MLVEAFYSVLVQVEGQAWFGGGADLTPAYLCKRDAREFHTFWHDLCSKHKVRLANDTSQSCAPVSSHV